MILEDGAEHQSSLDTALAQPQAQDLVRKFIGDASCRSVQGQAGPYVVILVLPHLCDRDSVLPSYFPSSLLVERTSSREDNKAGVRSGRWGRRRRRSSSTSPTLSPTPR